MRTIRGIGLVAVWTALLLIGVGAAAPVSGRTAAMVFLDSWRQVTLPLPVTSLRAQAEGHAEAWLAGGGRDVVPVAEVVASAGRRRVRSGAVLPPSFLAELGAEHGVDELVVVDVILEPARLVVMARGVGAGDGMLLWLQHHEQTIDQVLAGVDPPVEQAALEAALQRAFAALILPAGAAAVDHADVAPTLLLPASAVGCTGREARLVTHCLLADAVSAGLRPVDSAVAVAALMDAGSDPHRLDRDACALLRQRFGARTAIRPQLVGYGDADAPSRRAIGDDPDELVAAVSSLHSFTLNLFGLDLADGLLTGGAAVHVVHQGRVGWFGVPDRTSLLERLTAAAHDAWAGFGPSPEDI
jgi:hypothetical protein